MAAERWQEHFATPAEQSHAAQLGMWVFIASEVMLFGGLFAMYAFYRTAWGAAFRRAIAEGDLWLGGAMTLVLLVASLFVAFADQAARRGLGRRTAAWLLAAVACACGFLLIHVFEYLELWRQHRLPGIWYSSQALSERGTVMFYSLFWMMTGLHFVHVAVGAVVLTVIASRAARGIYSVEYHVPVGIAGMYWQLVDTIWMFLFPLFYCAR